MQLDSLNAVQRQAVEQTEGPCLILAGAGSGKTRVLTYRIAHLIHDLGTPPWSILAITFTNKAAREMQHRVEELVGEGAQDVWVGTFHSWCAFVLRRDADRLGYSRSFTIYDADDQMQIITEIMKQMQVDEKHLPKRMVRTRISQAKNASLSPDEALREWSGALADADVLYKIYKKYEEKMLANSALDFDDLLLKALRLLQDHADVLEKYRQRFNYIHVDEYQDTNSVQYQLVQLLAKLHKNLCVVGDDDQSIYSWRGADISNILNFEKDYPEANVFRLEQNYRSTTNILDAANGVISNNTARKQKKLWSDIGHGTPVVLYTARDEYDEAEYVVNNIAHLVAAQGLSRDDIAILYRIHAQSRVLEEKLVGAGIPYRVYGGVRFYERREIKDILAYLRLCVNPADEVSLRRVINTPRRGIGTATVQKLADYAAQTGQTLLDAVFAVEDLEIRGAAKSKIAEFGELVSTLVMLSQTQPIHTLLEELLRLTEYKAYVQKEYAEDAQTRLENIDELFNSVAEYLRELPEGGLSGFLEAASLALDGENEQGSGGAVTLMTLHSAKGLEFEAVFLVGMEDTVFPGANRAFMQELLEEERRLCYVGFTRAKRRLTLTHALQRYMHGDRKASLPSRFLKEIPKHLLEIVNPFLTNLDTGGRSRTEGSGQHSQPDAHIQAKYARATRPADTPIPQAAPANLKPADKVEHNAFGRGTVVSVDGDLVTIAFESKGIKKLSTAFAPLKRIEDGQ